MFGVSNIMLTLSSGQKFSRAEIFAEQIFAEMIFAIWAINREISSAKLGKYCATAQICSGKINRIGYLLQILPQITLFCDLSRLNLQKSIPQSFK